VIIDVPKGSTSSSIEETLGFWIDEAAKTLVLADDTPLTVRRFDDRWISASRGDMSYGRLEKFLSPSPSESDSVTARG
jgi:hypothetical protein